MKSSEDIIKGLEVCSKLGRSCCSDECPYYKQNKNCAAIELKQDALALIKQCCVASTIQLTIPYGVLRDIGCGDCVCRICARNGYASETELYCGCDLCCGPVILPDYCPRNDFLLEKGE